MSFIQAQQLCVGQWLYHCLCQTLRVNGQSETCSLDDIMN